MTRLSAYVLSDLFIEDICPYLKPSSICAFFEQELTLVDFRRKNVDSVARLVFYLSDLHCGITQMIIPQLPNLAKAIVNSSIVPKDHPFKIIILTVDGVSYQKQFSANEF